jgi:hypothetical protein
MINKIKRKNKNMKVIKSQNKELRQLLEIKDEVEIAAKLK